MESLIFIYVWDCLYLLNIGKYLGCMYCFKKFWNIISEYEILIKVFYRILMDVFLVIKNIIEEIILLKF